jgi:hypothetical protein
MMGIEFRSHARHFKDALIVLLALGFFVPLGCRANFLDELKAAAQKLQQVEQAPPSQAAPQAAVPEQGQTSPEGQPAQSAQQEPAAEQVSSTSSIPDSECCTAKAMKRYAKQASFLDIVGIRLGMTPKEAFAAVHAFNRNMKIDIVKAKLEVPGVPEGQYPLIPRYAVAHTGPTITSGDDLIWIQFTTPPNPPLVESITREVVFQPGHPVFASTLLAGLRKKYGQENVPSGANNLPVWVYGPDGKLLQRQLTQGERYCGMATPIYPNISNNMAPDITWDQYAKDNSYSAASGNGYPYEARPECIPFTFATTGDANLITSPKAQNTGVTVGIDSPALLYASWRSTQEWLEAKAEAAQQAQQQAVKKNAAPTF